MKSTIHENQENNRFILSKKLVYYFAIITLLVSLASCTADDLPTEKPIKKELSTMAKEGDIVPPGTLPPPR